MWTQLGAPVTLAWLTSFETLAVILSSTSAAFNQSWLVYGQAIIDNIAAALLPIIQITTEMYQIIGEKWAEHITPVVGNIMALITDLTGTFAYLGEKLLWVWDNGGSKLWAGILDLAGAFAELVSYVVTYVYGEFIDPLVSKLADVLAPAIATVFDKVGELLGGFKDLVAWLLGDGQPVLETIIIVLGSFATAWGLVSLWQGIASVATGIWSGVAAVSTGVTAAFGAAVAFLTSPFFLAVAAIGAAIAIGVLLWKNWDTVKAKAFELWAGIKAAFKPVGKFFGDLWDGVKRGFVGFVNFIVRGINTMIKGFLSPVNALISGWNMTVGRVTGQIPTIRIAIPEIPALAAGGLAYGEVTALVGDNFNSGQDPEVISPLSTLKNIILEALLQKDIATGDEKQIRVILTLENGETLVDMLIDPINNKAKNLGYAPVFKPA